MYNPTLLTNWYISLAVAGIIVLIAAALLIGVWLAARRILRLALEALDLVQQIKHNTQSIWALENTNATAQNILENARSIKTHANQVAETLHSASVEEI